MTVTTLSGNGRVRKNLADQLDRLDGILDGLAEGLNEAVVAAVKEAVMVAVREAVRSVLAEVLTNPDFLRMVQASVATAAQANTAPTTPTAARKPRFHRLVKLFSQAKAWVCRGWVRVRQAGPVLRHGVGQVGGKVQKHCHTIRLFKTQLLKALAMGMTVAVAAYFAAPWLGALVGGLGGFATTLAVQAGLAMRRILAALTTSTK